MKVHISRKEIWDTYFKKRKHGDKCMQASHVWAQEAYEYIFFYQVQLYRIFSSFFQAGLSTQVGVHCQSGRKGEGFGLLIFDLSFLTVVPTGASYQVFVSVSTRCVLVVLGLATRTSSSNSISRFNCIPRTFSISPECLAMGWWRGGGVGPSLSTCLLHCDILAIEI